MRYWSGEVSWNSSTIATGNCSTMRGAAPRRSRLRARLQARQHVGEAELAVAPLQVAMRRAILQAAWRSSACAIGSISSSAPSALRYARSSPAPRR
jgi:hypothetical protein